MGLELTVYKEAARNGREGRVWQDSLTSCLSLYLCVSFCNVVVVGRLADKDSEELEERRTRKGKEREDDGKFS